MVDCTKAITRCYLIPEYLLCSLTAIGPFHELSGSGLEVATSACSCERVAGTAEILVLSPALQIDDG